MKDDWVKVFSDHEFLKVELAQRVFEENKIETYLMDHSDSSMTHLGNVQLFIHPDQAEKAIALLKEKGY